MVEYLLEHGAVIEAGEDVPIIYLAVSSGRAADVEMLIAAGAELHKRRSDRGNVLHQILESSSPDKAEIVKMLLQNGVDINCAALNGETPLISALILREEDIAVYLAGNGADVTHADEAGNTALH